MAYSLVSSAKTTGTSAGIDTTGATLLVIVQSAVSGMSAPSDSKGNTWTKLTEQGGSGVTAIYYAANPTVGTGHTFTQGGTAGSLAVAAFSGALTVAPFDQQSGAAWDGSSPDAAGSVTPSENNELVIAGAGSSFTGPSIDGGFTIAQYTDFVGGTNYGSALAYLIQTTATAANPSWTTTGGCAPVCATFKSSGGGGGGAKAGAVYHAMLGGGVAA